MSKINWNNFKTKFDGKEQDTFEFLSYILFLRELNQTIGIERYKNQAGIETEPIQINGEWIGFQAKFYETTISSNKKKIKEGIEKAKRRNPQLEKIYFYLNKEFSETSKSRGKQPKYKTEIETYAKLKNLKIVWRVPSHFEAQLYNEKNKDLARDFFSLSAENPFDETAFENYLQAVQAFSKRTPYLALNQLLSGTRLTLEEVYIPLSLQIIGDDEEESSDELKNDSDSEIRAGEQEENLNQDEKSKHSDDATKTASSLADIIKILKKKDKKKHILIQGTAGAGKSTVLHHIAKDAWENPSQLNLDEPHLPLVIRLRTLAGIDETSIEEKLSQSLHRGGDIVTLKKTPENFFSEWSRQKDAPWLIMFDGLDEVPADSRAKLMQWLDAFIDEIKNESHLIVLTSRALSEQQFQNQDKNFLVCDLLAFDRERQREFAVRWFPGNAEDFLDKIERFSGPTSVFRERLAMTPLLLTIAAVVYKRSGDLPETGQNELYERYIAILFEEAEERGLKKELGDKLFSVA